MGIADSIICPVTDLPIGQGEGNAVMDSKGNIWIVHANAGSTVRADATPKDPNKPTLHGHPPIMGPDAP